MQILLIFNIGYSLANVLIPLDTHAKWAPFVEKLYVKNVSTRIWRYEVASKSKASKLALMVSTW